MEKIKPMLFTTWKTYSKEQFVKDVIAGIIVAIIALPLSIALALASGVGPEQGIYTAIVAGFVISFLGGSQVQVAGPTAAFATIVAGIVAKNGFDGLVVATVLAGIILILMGLFHFGSLIKFIPYTITTGFTAGIAVTILIGQFKDFCGVTYPEGMATIETMEKLQGDIFEIKQEVLYVYINIFGMIYESIKDYENAEKCYRHVIDNCKQTQISSEAYQISCNNLSFMLMKQNKFNHSRLIRG